MTARTNARIAGITFLVYIVAGIASLALSRRAPATEVLTIVTSLCALVLGVTLYALTREQDPDLALLALTCRVIEAIPGRDGAIFFAVGSTLFSWLLLQGRMIPAAIAWLGIVASILMVVILPLQRAGAVAAGTNWASIATWLVWLPLLAFELTLAFWLIVKGVYVHSRA
jgi:hypothetical protein